MTMFDTFTREGFLTREIIPSFFTRQPLARHLRKRIMYKQKGKTIDWFYRLSAQSLTSYGRYATYEVAEQGDYVQLSLPWSQLFVARSLAGLDLDKQGKAGSIDDGTEVEIEAQAFKELKEDFEFGLNPEFATGDGAILNSGTGRTLYGVTQSVASSPSSGSYAGQNRASLSDLRNQQFAATSGPSGSPDADAWWLVMSMKMTCRQARKTGGMAYQPNILLGDQVPIEDILNKHFTQNTAVGADVNGMKSLLGFDISDDLVDDDLTANSVYMLSSAVWNLCTTASSEKDLFKLRVDKNLPWHIHERDCALVLRSAPMQLVDEFPKANGVITAWT